MAFLPIRDVAVKCAADRDKLFPSREPGVDTNQRPLVIKASWCICEARRESDIPLQFKAFGKGLISLNQCSAVWFISKKMKTTRMAMTILITGVAAAPAGNRIVYAGDRPLLTETERDSESRRSTAS